MVHEHYFEVTASYWDQIYEDTGVTPTIYQQRKAITLRWVAQLPLPKSATVLDLGCGAGCITLALAQSGHQVHAFDSAKAMLDLTTRKVEQAGVSDLVTRELGDAHHLTFEDGTFDLVVSLGLIPWLPKPELAIAEMTRVLKPGGYLIISADNRHRLAYMLDPARNRLCVSLWRNLRKAFRSGAANIRNHEPNMQSCGEFDRWIRFAGLRKLKSCTSGFGTFRFLRIKLLPDSIGLKANYWLQNLADRNWPVLKTGGNHHLVLATKSS